MKERKTLAEGRENEWTASRGENVIIRGLDGNKSGRKKGKERTWRNESNVREYGHYLRVLRNERMDPVRGVWRTCEDKAGDERRAGRDQRAAKNEKGKMTVERKGRETSRGTRIRGERTWRNSVFRCFSEKFTSLNSRSTVAVRTKCHRHRRHPVLPSIIFQRVLRGWCHSNSWLFSRRPRFSSRFREVKKS